MCEEYLPNWSKLLEHAPWPARDSAGELVFKGKMWLFGGYLPELVSDVWSSVDGVAWQNVGTVPDESGINIPVSFVYENKMWVVSNVGRLYSSADGQKWDLVTADLPWGGRYAPGFAVFKNKMWVMGGMKGTEIYNDIWSSTNGINWKLEVPEAPWSRRQLFGNVVNHAGKLWIIGGGIAIYKPFRAYQDVWSSEDGLKWTLITDQAPWPARIWSDCVVYRNRIWLLGGFRAQPTWNNFNDIWYSSDGANWQQLATENIWEPRHELSPYVLDDRLWVAGGNVWPLVNDVWQLNIPAMIFVTRPVIEEFIHARYRYAARADFNLSLSRIQYQLLDHPEWLKINKETGVVSGVPPSTGSFPVVIEAFDNTGESARQSYMLQVIPCVSE